MKLFIMTVAVLGFSQMSAAATFVFSGESIEIPKKGPANPAFIYVEGVEGVVTAISLKLNGISHQHAKETMLALSNPDGWATLIWAGAYCKLNNVDLEITDHATQDLEGKCSNGQYLPSGSYLPGFSRENYKFTIPIAPIRPLFTTLKELILPDPNGRWILWVEDFVTVMADQ